MIKIKTSHRIIYFFSALMLIVGLILLFSILAEGNLSLVYKVPLSSLLSLLLYNILPILICLWGAIIFTLQGFGKGNSENKVSFTLLIIFVVAQIIGIPTASYLNNKGWLFLSFLPILYAWYASFGLAIVAIILSTRAFFKKE